MNTAENFPSFTLINSCQNSAVLFLERIMCNFVCFCLYYKNIRQEVNLKNNILITLFVEDRFLF